MPQGLMINGRVGGGREVMEVSELNETSEESDYQRVMKDEFEIVRG